MSSTYGTTFKKKEGTLNTEYRNIKIPFRYAPNRLTNVFSFAVVFCLFACFLVS